MVKNIDMTKTVTVKSVGEYITCISESTQQDQPYIYRGQSDCKWNIESSAYRCVYVMLRCLIKIHLLTSIYLIE